MPVELDQALELARRFHDGQTDQAGRPYIGHILRVVDSVDSPDEKLVAALHDLLEDTPVTANDLLVGISETIGETRSKRP
jgi:(p)ppGpp synthase/HD superfamily hydrolase